MISNVDFFVKQLKKLLEEYKNMCYISLCALVAELVDAVDSKSTVLWDMGVRVSPRAPLSFYFWFIFRWEVVSRLHPVFAYCFLRPPFRKTMAIAIKLYAFYDKLFRKIRTNRALNDQKKPKNPFSHFQVRLTNYQFLIVETKN